jgi:hypothetical protein
VLKANAAEEFDSSAAQPEPAARHRSSLILMPLSSAVRERCRPFLPPGEALRYLLPATSVQLGRGVFGVAPFIIAITDTQVVVLSCGWFKRHKPKSVWARYPRAVQLGPVNTSLAPTFTIGNLVLGTDEEYVLSSEPLTLNVGDRRTASRNSSRPAATRR